MSPCSIFKIAISLMGFDSGILLDDTHPTCDFKPGYVDCLERWKQPHNPKMWLANSCVWYSQMNISPYMTAPFPIAISAIKQIVKITNYMS